MNGTEAVVWILVAVLVCATALALVGPFWLRRRSLPAPPADVLVNPPAEQWEVSTVPQPPREDEWRKNQDRLNEIDREMAALDEERANLETGVQVPE